MKAGGNGRVPDLKLVEGTYKFLQRKTYSPRDLANGYLSWERYQDGHGYQRARTSKAGEIAVALKAGGDCPDPVWVSRRDDGTEWIVDGLQRYLGHWDAARALVADVYRVKDVATEEMIFHILNARKPLNASHVAMTWPCASGLLMAMVNSSGPLAGHLNTASTSSSPNKISAATFAKALHCCLTGRDSFAAISYTMAGLDAAIRADSADSRSRAESFCQFIGDAFIGGPPLPGTVLRAFALVWRRKTSDRGVPPKVTARQIRALQRPAGPKDQTWKALAGRVGHEARMVERVIIPAILERWEA